MIHRLEFEFGQEEKPVIGGGAAPAYVFKQKLFFGKELVCVNTERITEVLWKQSIGQEDMLRTLFDHAKEEVVKALKDQGELPE